MKQGDIWFATLDPVIGSEQADYRPVIVVSGNLMNTYGSVVYCCPLTSKIKNYAGNPILEPSTENGLKVTTEVMIHQMRSISIKRLKTKVGKVDAGVVNQIKQTINDIIDL